MVVYHNKSAYITNRDATPQVRNTAGKEEGGRVAVAQATIAPTVTAGIDTTIQLVRVPFSVRVNKIEFWGDDLGSTGDYDLGAYYATDGSNGVLSVATLLAANAIDQDFFGTTFVSDGTGGFYAVIVPGKGWVLEVATPRLITPAWAASDNGLQLWDALGLSADPGGNCDIVATVHEATDSTAGKIGCRVEYSAP